MKKFVKKDRLNKLKLIDDLLQSKIGYTMKEMMEKLEVSSKDTIRTKLGYKNGLKLGIRHGEYWTEYLLEKYDPEKINIITEEKESIVGMASRVEKEGIEGKGNIRTKKESIRSNLNSHYVNSR